MILCVALASHFTGIAAPGAHWSNEQSIWDRFQSPKECGRPSHPHNAHAGILGLRQGSARVQLAFPNFPCGIWGACAHPRTFRTDLSMLRPTGLQPGLTHSVTECPCARTRCFSAQCVYKHNGFSVRNVTRPQSSSLPLCHVMRRERIASNAPNRHVAHL